MSPLKRPLTLWTLAGLLACLWLAPTIWATLAGPTPAARASKSSELEDMSLVEQVTLWAMSAITGSCFLVVGACVGSFLNVVVHRWPRRLSLSHPPSRCPSCETAIESRDNLPVIGWLRLRGRCRACQGPISIRYPLVESFVGALFVGLLIVELLSGGGNLPLRPINTYAGVVWILWYTKWDLVAIYAFHLTLLIGLLLSSEFARDGFSLIAPPGRRSLALWFATAGLLVLAFLPDLHLVPLGCWPARWNDAPASLMQWPEAWRSTWNWTPGLSWRGPLTGAVGGLAGLLSSGMLHFVSRGLGRSQADARSWLTSLPLIGIFLGWQTVSVTAVSALGLISLLRPLNLLLPRIHLSSPDLALIVTCVGLCLWRWLIGWIFVSPGTPGFVMFHSIFESRCLS